MKDGLVMKNLRNIQVTSFIKYMGTALIYPVYVWITSDEKLLKFIDAMTIVGLVFLVFGVVLSMVNHGDFDIMEYVTRRSASSMKHETIKPFQAFKEDKNEKRKDSVNYPFLTGILMLLIAGLLVLFVY